MTHHLLLFSHTFRYSERVSPEYYQTDEYIRCSKIGATLRVKKFIRGRGHLKDIPETEIAEEETEGEAITPTTE